MYVTIEEVLKQLQITPYTEAEKEIDPTLQDEENDYLIYAVRAEAAIANDINSDLYSYTNEADELPEPLKQAVLMMARHLYDHRTPVDHNRSYEVPYSIGFLTKPYKIIYV